MVPWVEYQPPMDVYETDKAIVVEMELPEVDISLIKIISEGNRLIIEGVKDYSINLERVRFLRLERFKGPFRRVVVLPFTPEPEAIRAVMKKGILKIEVKKQTKLLSIEEE